jgi:hypothetical protein
MSSDISQEAAMAIQKNYWNQNMLQSTDGMMIQKGGGDNVKWLLWYVNWREWVK